MSSPNASALSRILLVGEPSRPPAGTARSAGPAIRRYRLARLRLDTPRDEGDRFAHLRRSYD